MEKMDGMPPSSGRRDFIRKVSAASLVLAFHPVLACAPDHAKQHSVPITTDRGPRIRKLKLFTSTPLADMRAYYHGLLEMDILDETKDKVSFAAGESELTYIQAPPEMGDPWYHVAFNIPENKLLSARSWHLRKSDLILTAPEKRTNGFPDEVRSFPHWNAHSLFFWDPAGNLLEYIARHDLENRREGAFSALDILYISEIGFVVDDQHASATLLHKDIGLEVYPRGDRFWWAMGDQNGLLLCVPKGKIWGTHTDRPQEFDIYPTEAFIQGAIPQTYHMPGYPQYKIHIT